MMIRSGILGLCLLTALPLLAEPTLAQGSSSSGGSSGSASSGAASSGAAATPAARASNVTRSAPSSAADPSSSSGTNAGVPDPAARPSLAIPNYLSDDPPSGSGAVINGRRRQPTRMEMEEKLGVENADKELKRRKETRDLFDEVMRNSAPSTQAK